MVQPHNSTDKAKARENFCLRKNQYENIRYGSKAKMQSLDNLISNLTSSNHRPKDTMIFFLPTCHVYLEIQSEFSLQNTSVSR